MKSKKLVISIVSLASAFTLAGCASNEEDTAMDEGTNQNEQAETDQSEMDHSHMDHSGSDDVPENLQVAENPTYEVGDTAMITNGHMEGMEGAEATIVGAYDTVAYAVSYTPSTGGERVTNHKWVIHEEIEEAGEEPLSPGTEVTIDANHMEGMDGVTAEIDAAEQTTVYMVHFTPATGGEEVTNHKWVTEDELSPTENK